MIPFKEAKQLVIGALEELTNDECPRCNYSGLISGCIGDEDIEKFLRRHGITDTHAYCPTCGTDTGTEFELTHKPHMCRRVC